MHGNMQTMHWLMQLEMRYENPMQHIIKGAHQFNFGGGDSNNIVYTDRIFFLFA